MSPVTPRDTALAPTARTLRETYDDPTTGEDYLLANGVLNPADFAAAMARDAKSAALLDELTDYAADYSYCDYAEAVGRVLALVAEPDLRKENLLDIAWKLPATRGPGRKAELIGAICAHPNATSDVLIAALWNAGSATTRTVAAATGIHLIAVIAWVHARMLSGGYADERARARIDETNLRWAAWCGDNPARHAFLLSASFNFACEETMFAAGVAILAPPAATHT